MLSLLTGHFRNLLYFTIIIFIHECGHFITGKLLGFKLIRIEIYPYGGCSKLEYDINVFLYQEVLVLIMGPLTQIIFTLIIYLLDIPVKEYFYTYSFLILIFNLLPIYPLDGGKLLNLSLAYFISYYNSLKKTMYFSFLIYILFLYFVLFFYKNLMLFLILILLGFTLKKEIKHANYYYQKFLMERYLNNYSFTKIKRIENIKKMRRDYYHYFISNNNLVDEKSLLQTYFS